MAPHSSILAWRIPWTEEPGHPFMKMLRKENNAVGTKLHFSLPSSQRSVHTAFRATASPWPCTGFRHCKDVWGSRVPASNSGLRAGRARGQAGRAPGRAVWRVGTMKRRQVTFCEPLGGQLQPVNLFFFFVLVVHRFDKETLTESSITS